MKKPQSPQPLRAKYTTACEVCGKPVNKGAVIKRTGTGYGHPACAEYTRNKRAIESGDTFRSRRPSDWTRGNSPSSNRGRRR